MRVSSFVECQFVCEAFGRRRVRQVAEHMRELWPGFPQGDTHCSEFITAWLIAVLSKCRSYSKTDVARAIRDISELKCNGEHFITWLGNALYNGQVSRVSSIFIFQSDNMAIVHLDREALLFQGNRRACRVDRSAVLNREFLMDVRELISPMVQETYTGPIFEYDGDDADDPISID